MNQQQKDFKERLLNLMRKGAWLPHHDCSACAQWVHYFMRDGHLYFDSNCGCTRFTSQPRLCSLNDIDHMVLQAGWVSDLQAWVRERERQYVLAAAEPVR